MSLPPPEHEDHVDARFKRHNCYTAEQMQAYGQQCRDATLEEAAQVCSNKAETKRLYLNEAHYLECAEAIRSLK